jgi:hypothetical protein
MRGRARLATVAAHLARAAAKLGVASRGALIRAGAELRRPRARGLARRLAAPVLASVTRR